MGRDKASLRPAACPAAPPAPSAAVPAAAVPADCTLAERTARILSSVCSPSVEVGPGRAGLPAVREHPEGAGPLAALVAGWAALRAGGWPGPVIVVATDLPALTPAMISWLAERTVDRSVVPVAAGRVQPLCARYSPSDLDVAAGLVAGGQRAMTALLTAIDPELVPEDVWAPAVGGRDVLADADTPEDLDRIMGR